MPAPHSTWKSWAGSPSGFTASSIGAEPSGSLGAGLRRQGGPALRPDPLCLERRGTPIGVNDLHIAAHARSEGLTLVSNNLSDFERVEGLLYENWV